MHAGAIACVGMTAACQAQEESIAGSETRHFQTTNGDGRMGDDSHLAEDGRVDGVTDVLSQRRKGVQARHLPPKQRARSAARPLVGCVDSVPSQPS